MGAFEWSVVILGLLTVFVGLICIIIICTLMSWIFRKLSGKHNEQAPIEVAQDTVTEIPNRREMIAAVSAAIAEDMGTDIRAIRIVSVKKL